MNLPGLASYYNTGGKFNGLGFDYWGTLDGIAFHSYLESNLRAQDHFKNYLHWRREKAREEGLKLIVTEYSGVPNTTTSTVANDAGAMRAWLKEHLGGNTAYYNYNPRKLMWFGSYNYGTEDLFTGGGSLTDPVGIEWAREHGLNN